MDSALFTPRWLFSRLIAYAALSVIGKFHYVRFRFVVPIYVLYRIAVGVGATRNERVIGYFPSKGYLLPVGFSPQPCSEGMGVVFTWVRQIAVLCSDT